MDIERDEMFRLTSIKMSNWSLAAKIAAQTPVAGAAGAQAMGTKNKGGKKDKPNPC